MRMGMKITCGLMMVIILGFVAPVFADAIAESGRAVLDANKGAVITVRMVISTSFGGQSDEMTQESTAVVIDPSGLSVLALSGTDPFSQIVAMMGEEMSNQLVTKMKDVKMLLSDGSEIDAMIILRDRDLDLAFVRPAVEPTEPMTCVDLTQGTTPQLLDQFFVLQQLGKVARRGYSVFIERIESVVEKPRTFYVPGEHRAGSIMSSPCFSLDGKFLGVGVNRSIKTSSSEMGGYMSMMMGKMPGNMMTIIVPADDIAEVSQQAPPFGEEPEEEISEETADEEAAVDAVVLENQGEPAGE